MREIGFIVWIWLLSIAPSFAQKQIKGKVKDMNGNPIAAANVSLKSNDSKILTFTKTDEKGFFLLSYGDESKIFNVEVSIIGYEKKSVLINDLNKNLDIIIKESKINLKTVVVKNQPSLTLKGDTLNYKTSDFADKQDRTIGDVLKKMRGITL